MHKMPFLTITPLVSSLQVFERQEIKDGNETCTYRLAQEGLPFILPFISRQRVQLSKEDFLTLLRERQLMMPGANILEQQPNPPGWCIGTCVGLGGSECWIQVQAPQHLARDGLDTAEY